MFLLNTFALLEYLMWIMPKYSKNDNLLKQPFFKGGNKALGEFIGNNLKYPDAAISNKIEGQVIVKYDIDYKGNVVAGEVIKSLGYGCDEEAIRIVKLLKFEVPKIPRNLNVTFHKTTIIYFKMPKVAQASPQIEIQYQYSQKPPKVNFESTKTYTYTLNI